MNIDKAGMNIDKADIGARIKAALESAKVSQRDLSRALNITEPSVSAYTSGKSEPSASGFATISRLTGVSIDWLITGKEPEPKGEARPAASRPLDEKERGVIATVEDLLELYGLNDRYALVEVGREGGGPELSDEEQRLLAAFRRLDRKIQEALLIQAEMTAEGLQKSAKKEPHGGGLMEAV